MPPFLYRCPNTGSRVQGYVAEEVPDDTNAYELITCLASRPGRRPAVAPLFS